MRWSYQVERLLTPTWITSAGSYFALIYVSAHISRTWYYKMDLGITVYGEVLKELSVPGLYHHLELYVFTEPIFEDGGKKTIGRNRVAILTSFFNIDYDDISQLALVSLYTTNS
jgi:hypothetical protein